MDPHTLVDLVEANKDGMNDTAYKNILEGVAASRKGGLYRLTWTIVNSHAHVVSREDEEDFACTSLVPKTQTLLVEAVDKLPIDTDGSGDRVPSHALPHKGMMLKSWVDKATPFVLKEYRPFYADDWVAIVHTIQPYESRA